ncbi:MAG TPA: beta-galactosidase [Acidobacteriaceae bacterium]
MSKLPTRKIAFTIAAAFPFFLSAAALSAQGSASTPLVIDASAPTPAPGPANYTFDPADARSPSGHTLGLNAQYLTLDGKPWLPVMGEIHYSRVPEAEWETEILKMKSAGVQIISTYLIWIHHEEIEGQWDWSGQKDLHRFVQLCAKHGMYVVPRIGPWSHAEVRNGGFPDWLLAETNQTRSNDPTYLHAVDLYYQQIAAQLKGLMWSEGGPVVAIQLENEYRGSGPTRGTAHILKLKELARTAGLRVPFYTVTGWDGASIPKGDVLPVYGGYPDAPWDASIQKLPPSEVYAFRFGSRVTGDMGAIGTAPTGNAANFTTDTPFMTAEMGGGMQVTYHRRPIVSADDIAAMMPVMLGSGVNLYGSYMFHGGENPDGKLTTLQESLATHYANDLPQKTYDFEAPIGEFGDERESLLKLKTWNYFLNDFGPTLAPMQPHKPNVVPANARDLSVPRVSARTSGSSGFLFVNNHVRGYPMPARPGFQVTIKLPGDQTLTIPSSPVTLEPDAYFAWPFNMDLSGLHLRYATAQPFAVLGTKDAPIYVFIAELGVTEFVIDDIPGLKLAPARQPGEVIRRNGVITLIGNTGEQFTLPNGKVVSIILLSHSNAEHAWKIESGQKKTLLITQQQAFVDGDTATLQDLSENNFNAFLIPSGANLVSLNPSISLRRGIDLSFTGIISNVPSVAKLTATQSKPADAPAPLPADFRPSNRPRVVAAAPTDADFSRAGIWSITLPKSAMANAPNQQRFLVIHYTGDVAHLSASGGEKDHLLDDNFADGRPWLVGLSRFAPQLAQSGGKLSLSIYPLRPNPPIFFEPSHEPKPDSPPAAVQSVEILAQYTLKIKLEPPSTKKK